MRNQTRTMFWVAALAAGVTVSTGVRAGGEKTFKGEIADTQCALNVHSLSQSHEEMMGMKPEIKTNADCARYCVKERGGRFVLQIKDKVYKLDRQDLAEPSAGLKVKVIGVLDPKTTNITVRTIEPIQESPANPAHPK